MHIISGTTVMTSLMLCFRPVHSQRNISMLENKRKKNMNSSYEVNDSVAVALTEAPKANEPDVRVTGRRARWTENKKAVCHLVFI